MGILAESAVESGGKVTGVEPEMFIQSEVQYDGVTEPVSYTHLDVYKRQEHWNDASASKSESWNLWKENWDKYSKNYENVSLTPGADETQLNFAYYSKTAETPKVKIATNKDMTDAKEVELSLIHIYVTSVSELCRSSTAFPKESLWGLSHM